MVEHVQVGEFTSTEEATIARGLLVAHGIDAVTKIESAGGAYPQLAARVRGGTGVHVPIEQAEEARSLLDDVADPNDPPAPGAPGDGAGEAAEWRGPTRARRAGRVIVVLLFVVPLVLSLVELLGSSS